MISEAQRVVVHVLTGAAVRAVRSSTSDGLAVAASVLTIFTAIIGAPFTIASRLFKA